MQIVSCEVERFPVNGGVEWDLNGCQGLVAGITLGALRVWERQRAGNP